MVERTPAELSTPVSHGVTPSDGVALPATTRAIYQNTTGAATVVMAGGQTVSFPSLLAGWHPMQITQVVSGSSTIRAFW